MNFIRRAKRALTIGSDSESNETAPPTILPPKISKEISKTNQAILNLQNNAKILHFSSGLQAYRYLSMRATPTLNGRATSIRIPDEWLLEKDPIRMFSSNNTTGTNVVIVGFQNYVTSLSNQSLMAIFKVVSECCTGSFDVMIHKLNSDVKLVATLSPEDRYLQRANTTTNSDTTTKTTNNTNNTNTQTNPTTQQLPESELLQTALSFAHSVLTVLPSDTIFMDIISGVNMNIEQIGDAIFQYIKDGGCFSAIMSPHNLVSMRMTMSIIRYTLRTHMIEPLIPTPVLQAFGKYFEDNSSRTTTGKTLPKSQLYSAIIESPG